MEISNLMTASPISIVDTEMVSTAKRIMAEKAIKHLPVTDGNYLVTGILSDRDLKLQQAISSDPNFHNSAKITDIYRRSPYCVAPHTEAGEVVDYMYSNRIGSALITEHGKLVGIFTSMDACRVLAKML